MNRYFKLAEDGRIEGRAVPVGLSNSLFQLPENGKTEGIHPLCPFRFESRNMWNTWIFRTAIAVSFGYIQAIA